MKDKERKKEREGEIEGADGKNTGIQCYRLDESRAADSPRCNHPDSECPQREDV